MRKYFLTVSVVVFLFVAFWLVIIFVNKGDGKENGSIFFNTDCSQGMFDASGNCICRAGLVFNKKVQKCVDTDQDCKIIFGENTEAKTVSNGTTNSCFCKDGYSWNRKQDNCIKIDCSGGTVDEKGLCKCNTGFVWSPDAGECLSYEEDCNQAFGAKMHHIKLDEKGVNQCKCEDGYVLNKLENKCEKMNCDNGKFLKDGSCQCNEGFVFSMKEFRCIDYVSSCKLQLGENALSKFTDASQKQRLCYCADGYVLNQSKDACLKVDCSNGILDKNLSCTCNKNYVWNAALASCVTMEEDCKSVFGTYSFIKGFEGKTNNQCYCQSGSMWNTDKSKCVPFDCSKGKILNNNSCQCGEGYVFNNVLKMCLSYQEDCDFVYGDNIRSLGPNIETKNNQCVCDGEYEWNFNKTKCLKTD